QVLLGDIPAANSSHRGFFDVWQMFGVLPERYLLDFGMLHPTEKYYPLRPEFAESTFYLYQATRDPWYLEVGKSIVNSLNLYARVNGGFASIRDVVTMELEDHQHSFFLSETCKYLYLLFDDSALADRNYVFTTEGHPLPILGSWHEAPPAASSPQKRGSPMSLGICPSAAAMQSSDHRQRFESVCHVPDARPDHRCAGDEDCGVDAATCRRRYCSVAGYCG
ncbi:hypothetical protein M569_16118, partial [Genlisea aurea]